MAGISRAERERRATERAKVMPAVVKAAQDALVQPYAGLTRPIGVDRGGGNCCFCNADLKKLGASVGAGDGNGTKFSCVQCACAYGIRECREHRSGGSCDPAPLIVDVVTDKIPAPKPALYATDGFYLHALCAALPYSGTTKAWEPLSFADRLEAAKVNAELILRAVGER